MVEGLWAEAKALPRETLHEEVDEWVLDPGSTAGRASVYDQMLLTYWVTVCLAGHSASLREAKQEGDGEPIPFWKEHNAEYHTMHHKLDVLVAHLGFPSHLADRRAMETARPQEKIGRCVQEDPGVSEEAH